MELALYCPVYGYYERRPDSPGRRGDFQTSVSVGDFFGRLLAARFAGWTEEWVAAGAERVEWVEVGAHHGQLAGDILAALTEIPDPRLDRIEYRIIEPSAARRAIQQERLSAFHERLRWGADLESLAAEGRGVARILFSNELLDALPVSRFAWDAGKRRWTEDLVGVDGGRFVWRRGGAVSETMAQVLADIVPQELHAVLPDQYVVEYSERATTWWADAVQALDRGKILAFDYGFDAVGALSPERVDGTLRGYRRHALVSDVLASPGEQDLTAHVHFDVVRRTGEMAGARTEFLGSQERFLVQALTEAQQAGRLSSTLNERQLRQFKTLIHPEHFGRLFQVLVQSKS